MRAQRLLGRGDRNRGVAVAVAADPAREAQEAVGHRRAGVMAGHGALERGRDLGGEIVERRLEVVEAVPDLVHGVGTVGARLFRLPQRHQLLAQCLERCALLLGCPRLGIERPQQLRDPRQLGEHRAPLGLGRVRGEDRLDQQPVDERRELGLGDARVPQLADRGLDRLGHRPARARGFALAPAQHAHALALLGQVDELEVRGERLQHAARLGERQAFDPLQQPLAGCLVPGAVRLGQGTHLLDEVEERLALLLDDRLPEQVPEPVDVLAQTVALARHGA